jgi:hypothetical protein
VHQVTRIFSLALIFSVGIVLILGSTSQPNRPVSPVSKISDIDFDRYNGVGKCSIKGQAFLKTRGGDVKYGAGEAVTLVPDLPLLNDILRINSTPGQYSALPPDVERKWQQLTRKTQANGQGEFEFNGIPCESWFVESRVSWEVPISRYSTSLQGGPVSTRVNISPQNSPAKVILTQ